MEGFPVALIALAVDAELTRRRAKRLRLPPMLVPSAAETHAAIVRFREAVERFKQTEFHWEMDRMRALTDEGAGGILRRRPSRRTPR